MREDLIKTGVAFLNQLKDKNVSLNDQKEMLKSKNMSEEEITEVYKRLANPKSTSADRSGTAINRIKQIDNHFDG